MLFMFQLVQLRLRFSVDLDVDRVYVGCYDIILLLLLLHLDLSSQNLLVCIVYILCIYFEVISEVVYSDYFLLGC